MAKTIKLALVLFKCGLNKEGNGAKKSNGTMAINAVLLVCMLPIIYFVFQAGALYAHMMPSIDKNGLVLNFLMFILSAFCFGIGVVVCVNSFYLSTNLETLLVMPFTPGQITGAKFLVAAVYEYYISVAVLAPFLVGLGWTMKAPVIYWVGALAAIILVPLPPLAVGGIVAMLIMRVIGASKNKERTTILGAVCFLVFWMGYDIIRSAMQGKSATDMEHVLADISKQLQGLTHTFPDIPLFGKVLLSGQWSALLYIFVIVAIYLAVFWFVAGRLYLAGAIGMQEGGGKHSNLTAEELERNVKASKIGKTCMVNDLKSVLRTPAYYLNCLFLTLGWPIILIVPMLFSGEQKSELENLGKLLFANHNTRGLLFVVTMLVCGITLFAGSLNSMATSAISREGQGYQVMKQLPIPYVTQLVAKRNAAYIICWIGSGGYLLIAEIILAAMGMLPWWVLPYSFIVNLLMLLIIVNIEMIAGLRNPILTWESEMDALKGKTNFFLFVLGAFALGTVAFSCYGPMSRTHMNPMIIGAIVVGCLLVVALLLEWCLRIYGEKRMEAL